MNVTISVGQVWNDPSGEQYTIVHVPRRGDRLDVPFLIARDGNRNRVGLARPLFGTWLIKEAT